MAEVIPCVAVFTVVLAHGAPLPLAQVGAPFLPWDPPFARFVQACLLRDIYNLGFHKLTPFHPLLVKMSSDWIFGALYKLHTSRSADPFIAKICPLQIGYRKRANPIERCLHSREISTLSKSEPKVADGLGVNSLGDCSSHPWRRPDGRLRRDPNYRVHNCKADRRQSKRDPRSAMSLRHSLGGQKKRNLLESRRARVPRKLPTRWDQIPR